MLDRRQFIRGSALGVFAFQIGGSALMLSPAEAKAAGADFKTLKPGQVKCLERLGEVLLPGAAQAGLAHYIDSQISCPHADSLLMIRYVDVPPPYAAFYAQGLANLKKLSLARHGVPFAKLDDARATEIVTEISAKNPEGWTGFPAPLFFFVTRSDAVEVVYGTMAGFEKLGVPYLPHIAPEKPW